MELFFYENDNLIELDGLQDSAGTYITNATVSVSSISGSSPVAGTPIAMPYEAGSNGRYRGTLPGSLVMSLNRKYRATIDVTGPAGSARFIVPFRVIRRRH